MRQQISIFVSTEQERVRQQVAPAISLAGQPHGLPSAPGNLPQGSGFVMHAPMGCARRVPCSPSPGPERDLQSGLWLRLLLAFSRPWRGLEGTSFNPGGHCAHEGVSKLFQNRTGCPERGESLSLEMTHRCWQTSCWEAEEGTSVARGQG